MTGIRCGMVVRGIATLAVILHELQLLRLRTESLLARILPGNSGRIRVLATACWSFPIYSQTFVYQELTDLIRNRFRVRFIYCREDTRSNLPGQFLPLWRSRRRAIMTDEVCQRAYRYFQQRYPETVGQLVADICSASGMGELELRRHHHFRQAFVFSQLAAAYGPDYLHSYFFYEGTLFAYVASMLLGIPRGVSCYADHMLQDYALKLVPLHLEQCRLVVATSERIKGELVALAPGTHHGKFVVKPNAINGSSFPPVAPYDDPATGDPFRLVCVNRIEPKKGLVYLVEALGILRGATPCPKLQIIGGADNDPGSRAYGDLLRQRIDELGLNDTVVLAGLQTETAIQKIFSQSHIYVAPFVETEYGDKDGIPTSLLEAMASGLPVVATNAGSIGEVMEDGVHGIIVGQRDAAALAAALASLMANPEQRARFGNNGAKRIRERFVVSVSEEAYRSRIRRLVDGGAPNPGNSESGNLRHE